jgi:hypothetical protein
MTTTTWLNFAGFLADAGVPAASVRSSAAPMAFPYDMGTSADPLECEKTIRCNGGRSEKLRPGSPTCFYFDSGRSAGCSTCLLSKGGISEM